MTLETYETPASWQELTEHFVEYKVVRLGLKEYKIGSDGSVFDIERGIEQPIGMYGRYKGFKMLIGDKKWRVALLHVVFAMAFLDHKPCGSKIVVDHISGDTLDNRLENLRLATQRENQQNRSSHRAGRLVGTCFNKSSAKWQSAIQINGVTKYLGTFDTEQEAHNAYNAALQEII